MNLSEQQQKNDYLKIIAEHGSKINDINSDPKCSVLCKQMKIQEVISEQHQKVKALLNIEQYQLYIDFFNEQLKKAKQKN